MWLCITFAEFCKDNIQAQNQVFQNNYHLQIFKRLKSNCPDIRASACYALGMLIGSSNRNNNQSINYNGNGTGTGISNNDFRVTLDILCAKNLVATCDDAASIVRYEAVLALGACVGSYLDVFAAIAGYIISGIEKGKRNGHGNGNGDDNGNGNSNNGKHKVEKISKEEFKDLESSPPAEDAEEIKNDNSKSNSNGNSNNNTPKHKFENHGVILDNETADEFIYLWTTLRGVQHTDPHPSVSGAANEIVQVVHERLMHLKQMQFQFEMQQQAMNNPNPPLSLQRAKSGLGDLHDGGGHGGTLRRNASDLTTHDEFEQQLQQQQQQQNEQQFQQQPQQQQQQQHQHHQQQQYQQQHQQQHQQQQQPQFQQPIIPFFSQYELPSSGFYSWKLSTFKETDDDANTSWTSYFANNRHLKDDVLSPEGALHSYRQRRNQKSKVSERSERALRKTRI